MTERRYYQDELVHPMEGLSVEEEKRNALVSALRAGELSIHINGQKIEFRIQDKDMGDGKHLLRITTALVGAPKNPITMVDATFRPGQKNAYSFKKDYIGEHPKFEGLGLITTSSALLAQDLIARGVEELHGEVWDWNDKSFQTRIKMPDFVRNGYFFHKIFSDSDGEGLLTLVTYFNKPKLAQPLTYTNAQLQ